MKYEGHFTMGTNQSGKGPRVSYDWSGKILNKISEGLGKIFPTIPKIKCDICKKIVKRATTTYHRDGTKTTVCSDCPKPKS